MTRPAPVPDPDTEPFWTAAARHDLRLPHCAACDRLLYPPTPRCPGCHQPVTTWRTVSGRGTLHGWTVVRADLVPGIEPPYLVAEIELAEQPGLLMASNVVGARDVELRVGMEMTLTWLDIEDGVSLPHFTPARGGR
jgi:uncharacterized OB-fold protein